MPNGAAADLQAHAEQGEVVLHGIVGIERAEGSRELQSGGPVGLGALHKAEFAGHAVHMEVEGYHQIGWQELLPQAEIHTLGITAYHPTQIHVQALASGVPRWGGDVLARALWGPIGGEHLLMKMPQSCLYASLTPALQHPRPYKSGLQRRMLRVVPMQEVDQIQEIGVVEGAVYKALQLLQIAGAVLPDEVVGRPIHPLHQFLGLRNNRFPLSPRKNGRKKARNFNVLRLAVAMRHDNRVFGNEITTVVGQQKSLKLLLDVGRDRHGRRQNWGLFSEEVCLIRKAGIKKATHG